MQNQQTSMLQYCYTIRLEACRRHISPTADKTLYETMLVYSRKHWTRKGTWSTSAESVPLTQRHFHSVPNKYDEFSGFPHYFWTFPSKQLDKSRAEYLDKLGKGLDFVLSRES